MKTIYIEKNIKNHPRVQAILSQVGKQAEIIECDYYGQVFNSKAQNFRIQKEHGPALILAQKQGRLVLPTPEGFGIGGQQNYYFSHMLNCLYDCRYCFLQGMYPSANYILFINYEKFAEEINGIAKQKNEPCYFFSGYDSDSLAFDQVSGFLDFFIPVFAKLPNAILELRSKSMQISSLLKHKVINNCVVAFSFTPDVISKTVEHKVPSVSARISALQKLAKLGWQIGLRFDPLIYHPNFLEQYDELISAIFSDLTPQQVHSVSIGPLRFPQKMWQKLKDLYPEDPLLAQPFSKRVGFMSYDKTLEDKMQQIIRELLAQYVSSDLLFSCSPIY